MSTIGEALAYYYSITNRTRLRHGKEPVSKGKWMMETYPNRYKNERQAAAAFNVTVREGRPGDELASQADVTTLDKFRDMKGRPMGGVQKGQWTVLVHYDELKDGNTNERTKSFNAVSEQHTTLLAIPYLQEYLLPVAQEKLDEWCDEYGGESCNITYIEVYPTVSFGKEPIDFDSLFV